MRQRKKSWAENELSTNEFLIHNPQQFKGNWREVFGNTNPIHLEIGCGKGRFIRTLAAQNPDINYIALERQSQVIISGMRYVRENTDLKNIRFVNEDVKNLEDIFACGEIKRLYINFCDPWENKKKWAKRRLTHKNFLNLYKKLFGSDGEIHFKTDNTKLFEFSLNEFLGESWTVKNISLDLHNSDFENNIMTEYEEKFSSRGMKIYRLEASYGKKAPCVEGEQPS